jgi:hypothetical protein
MKSNLKWYAFRAIVAASTMAGAFGLFVESGRRWL